MTLRIVVFAAALAAAVWMISSGVWMLSEPAGRITVGILGAGWVWLVLSEVSEESEE